MDARLDEHKSCQNNVCILDEISDQAVPSVIKNSASDYSQSTRAARKSLRHLEKSKPLKIIQKVNQDKFYHCEKYLNLWYHWISSGKMTNLPTSSDPKQQQTKLNVILSHRKIPLYKWIGFVWCCICLKWYFLVSLPNNTHLILIYSLVVMVSRLSN